MRNVWLRLDSYEPGSNPCNLYFFNLDSVCGELFTEEAIEREILALKFWVSGLLSLITGRWSEIQYLLVFWVLGHLSITTGQLQGVPTSVTFLISSEAEEHTHNIL